MHVFSVAGSPGKMWQIGVVVIVMKERVLTDSLTLLCEFEADVAERLEFERNFHLGRCALAPLASRGERSPPPWIAAATKQRRGGRRAGRGRGREGGVPLGAAALHDLELSQQRPEHEHDRDVYCFVSSMLLLLLTD